MVHDEKAEARGSVVFGPRAALALFVALEAIALPLMLSWGRGVQFNTDDWDFLATRKIGNFGDLMRPHFGHWTALPVIAYRLLWWLVGLRSYTPYLLLVIGAHLAVVALLRVVMRRAGIGPWLATLAAAIVLFFGSGAENVLIAFQVTFVGALAFGLGQLLLADHDGSLDRRDWLALLCGFAALLCSGVGVTMVFVVGLAVLLRRGWRIAMFHTVPLAIIYAIWLAEAPKGQSTSSWTATSPSAVFRFVAVGLQEAFARLGILPGVGVLLGLLLAVGLVLLYTSQGRTTLRGPVAVPLALLLGAIVFLVATGAFRSGQGGAVVHLNDGRIIHVGGEDLGLGFWKPPTPGPNRARLSRYVYVVGVLALPAIALAADSIIRRWRRVTVAVIALLAIGIPGNIARFSTYAHNQSIFTSGVRESLLDAAEVPLANQLPRSFQPRPFVAQEVTIGWLLDNRRTGRLPSRTARTPNYIATATIALVLQPSLTAQPTKCRRLVRPTGLVLRKGDSLTAKTGVINLIYLPAGGGRSLPRRLAQSKSVVALAGPLRLLLVAPPRLDKQGAVVCT
jgi:hypothetical protein